MTPSTRGKGTESYDKFLKEREELLSKTLKKIPSRLKVDYYYYY